MERKVPFMKESSPPHTHNVHQVEKLYGGDGHKHHQMHVKSEHHTPADGHKMHHEHVEAMCGGGMSKARK